MYVIHLQDLTADWLALQTPDQVTQVWALARIIVFVFLGTHSASLYPGEKCVSASY